MPGAGFVAIFDTDPVQAALSRRRLLGQVADTGTFVLPIHFPNPTVGRSRPTVTASIIRSCGRRFPILPSSLGKKGPARPNKGSLEGQSPSPLPPLARTLTPTPLP